MICYRMSRSSNSSTFINGTTLQSGVQLVHQHKKNNKKKNKIFDKLRKRRRPYRILIFAIFFVLTTLRRWHITTTSSHFDFLASLLLDTDYNVSISNSTNDRYSLARGANLIIFYNLYIPHDTEGIANAINVIKDQIGQIASVLKRMEDENESSSSSNGASGRDDNENKKKKKRGVVLYNLIGNEYAFTSQQMVHLCHSLHPRLDCQLLQYHTEESEAVTLQDLYDYCNSSSDIAGTATTSSSNSNSTKNNQASSTTSTTTRVVYLHSKGSYHSQHTNHIWRRQMTDAALHPHCLNPPNNTCDVCGAQFYIKYAIMFPGNMWTAKCSYVRRLVPPNTGEYTKRKIASIKQFLMLRLWNILHATLDTDNVEHFGLDRYQWEHWIASHPSIIPCELHSTNVGPLILLGQDPEGRTMNSQYYDWGMGPRRIDANLGGLRGPRLRLEANEERQFREYYYIPGNLLKWFHLYGHDGIPSDDSWVWDHFLGGRRWKTLVNENGLKAIDVMVRNSKPKFHSAYDALMNHTKSITMDQPEKLFGKEPTPPVIVIFYQISFPSSNSKPNSQLALNAVRSQFDAMYKGRYDNVTNVYDQQQRILLYYTVSGGTQHEIDSISKLCKEKSDRIICRQLGRYDTEGITGESLHHLYTFCKDKPSMFNVIHIANHLPGHTTEVEKTYDSSRIHAITTAVISKLCHMSDYDEDFNVLCNVCGTEFYPLPFLHFTGNMFAATCGYINNLLPPSIFEMQMNDVAADALLAQLEEVYTTKLIRFNERILGSYQHSVEHWIGSHPDLRPCDVAPLLLDTPGEESSKTFRMEQYSWSLAPRRGSAPPGYINDEAAELKFRLRREVALREYYYLAGNVLRWHRLYDRVPESTSWVWKWFPDGALWESAAKSGEDAVTHLIHHVSITDRADISEEV